MDIPSAHLVAALDVKKSSSSWVLSIALPMSTLLESFVAIRLVNIASNDNGIREPIPNGDEKLKIPRGNSNSSNLVLFFKIKFWFMTLLTL